MSPSSRKWIFATSLTLLGLVALLVFVIVGTVFYLRTSSGSQQVFSLARNFLEKNFETEITFEAGSIDLLSGLHFKNLHITRNAKNMNAVIDIAAFDLDYTFSVWQKSVDISDLRMVSPHIVLQTSSPDVPPEPPPQDQQENPLEGLLRAPPARLSVREIEISGLAVQFQAIDPTGKNTVEIPQLDLKMNLEVQPGHFLSEGKISIPKEISVQTSKKSITTLMARLKMAHDGHWKVDIREDKAAAKTQWVYNIAPLDLNVRARDIEMETTDATKHSRITLKSAKVDTKTNILLKTDKLLKFNSGSAETVDVTATGDLRGLEFESRAGAAPPMRLAITQQTLKLKSALKENVITDIVYEANGVEAKDSLHNATTLDLKAQSELSRDLKTVSATGRLALAKTPLVDFTLQAVHEGESQTKFSSHVDTHFTSAHAKLIKALASIPQGLAGNFDVEGRVDHAKPIHLNFKANIPALHLAALPGATSFSGSGETTYDSALQKIELGGEFTYSNPAHGSWLLKPKFECVMKDAPKINGQTEITQLVRPKESVAGALPLILSGPVLIHHDVDMTAGNGHADIQLEIPSVKMKGSTEFKNTNVKLLVQSVDLKTARDARVNLSMNTTAEGAQAKFETQLAADPRTKNLQGQGYLELLAKNDLNFGGGQRLKGKVNVPLTLVILKGHDMNVSGEIDVSGLSWAKDKLSVHDIDGVVPFSEKLVWDGKSIKFSELITQNPFERVDFERVRPLLQSTSQVRIGSIGWEEKVYGPFLGLFSLQQNMLLAHQFDVDLGTGRLYGEFFLDAYPQSLRFGMLSRLTGLDLGEILPAKFLARTVGGDKRLSGRAGFVVNLNRNTVDGRVDITEIGGPQLVALLNVLDPTFENEKMNTLRSVLQVGYPTSVAVALNDGYMSLDLGLRVLGVNSQQSLRAIPLSGFLSTTTSGILKLTEKGPLE